MRGWEFDLFSFGLGVLSSLLIVVLAYYLRSRLYEVGQWFRQNLQNFLPLGAQAEIQLRRDLIRFAQREHLLSPLFALDELLIPSRVLPLIPPWETREKRSEDTVPESVPLILDDPLLASCYGNTSFSVLEVLAKGNPHLLLLGELGSGKTTALLETALHLARGDHSFKDLYSHLPLYLHASQLLREHKPTADVLIRLCEAAKEGFSAAVRRSLSRLLRKAIQEQRLVILLDGLDELPPQEVDQVSDYLKMLLRQFPQTKIVLATSNNYLGDLVAMGFAPLALCFWNKNTSAAFLQTWAAAWQNTKLATPEEIVLWSAWAGQETHLLTPLEWTLFLLLLFLKFPTAPLPTRLLEASLCLNKIDSSAKQEIAQWAFQFLLNTLRRVPPPPPPSVVEKLALENAVGFSSSHPTFFKNPMYLALFASYALIDHEEELQNFLSSKWSPAVQAARIALASRESVSVQSSAEDLLRETSVHLAKALCFTPRSSEHLRNKLKQLASLILSDQETQYLRSRLYSALLRLPGEELLQLSRFMIQSKETFLRQIGALGYGLLGPPADPQPLINLLEDPTPSCFQSACLALVNLGSNSALDAVISTLIHGHDRLKEAAAQALANDPKIGHAILREAAQHEDARVRKAAIAGIRLIEAPWSKEILQKMMVEEEGWLVKDAAANALAAFESPNRLIPKRRPETANLSWLIQFAARKGLGLTPNKANWDVLLTALEEGDPEIQHSVLDFLLFYPLQPAVPQLRTLLRSPDPEIRSAVYRTLWSFSISR
ncbi:MAG: NACHT domain-containing protein [Anaerolineales bacterium]|nr:NACHT domain-containing protein [Anaerolineales bacterium]MCS7248952.1 NACHT domain-containing protein [Anaerolineales bacterium]MDW8162765.1 NACHT domain-containing protein [Anaerolineales bacterium]MDW8445861.1 NACHT domain-containing protein [Anaerolineales bacterium]